MSRSELIQVWWAFFWRGQILGFIAAVVASAAAYFLLGVLGIAASGPWLGAIVGFTVSFPIGLWALKVAITKEYRSFYLQFRRR